MKEKERNDSYRTPKLSFFHFYCNPPFVVLIYTSVDLVYKLLVFLGSKTSQR